MNRLLFAIAALVFGAAGLAPLAVMASRVSPEDALLVLDARTLTLLGRTVLLGASGGFGLLVGPLGLAALRQTRDPSLGQEESGGLDTAFLGLLFFTSLTGLGLLVLRHSALMGLLLVVHLAVVLVLMLTLPYGKFVHALYRVLALIKYHRDS